MNNSADRSTSFLPIWVWLIVIVQVVLVLFFSAGTAANPAKFIPDVTELNYVTQLYITRNVTVALGVILAVVVRSHVALLVMLIIRALTDIADVVTVYALSVDVIKSSVPMVIALLILPAIAAIGYLIKRIR